MPRRVVVALVTAAVAGVLAAVALAQPSPVVIQRPVAGAADDQGSTAVAMDAEGRFVVAWEQAPMSANSDVMIRRFGADLTPAALPQNVNDSTDRRYAPAIAMAPGGAIVVAYTYYAADLNQDVRAQRFAANGTPQGGEMEINTAGEAGGQSSPAVAMAPDGTFMVVWATNVDIKARTYSAAGAPLTAELTVDQSGASSAPAVAVDGDGRFVVAWSVSTVFGEDGRVMARRYNADGTADGNELPVFTGDENQNYGPPSVGLADDGSFVVVFTGVKGTLSGVLAQPVDASDVSAAPFKVNDTFSTVRFPAVAVDDDGEFSVAWEDDAGGTYGLRTHRFGSDAAPDGASQNAGNGGNTNPQPSIASDGDGRILIALTSYDAEGFNQTGAFISRFDDVATTTSTSTEPPPPPPPPAPDPAAPGARPDTPASQPPAVTPPAITRLPAFATVVSLPSARRCVSRRRFRIRIAKRRGLVIRQAEVAVNGKRVKVVRGARLTAPVDLRSLPRGRFSVKITVTTADGRKLTGTRRYRTCARKRRGRNRVPL